MGFRIDEHDTLTRSGKCPKSSTGVDGGAASRKFFAALMLLRAWFASARANIMRPSASSSAKVAALPPETEPTSSTETVALERA